MKASFASALTGEFLAINNPSVAKAGGIQIQGAKGEAIVDYCKPLATQDLDASGFPAGEKKWLTIGPFLEFTIC